MNPRCDRPLLIGQAPSRLGDPAKPCTGRFMRFLCGVAGVSTLAYLRAFERRNLLPAWPGKSGKGDAFPMEEARAAAAGMDVRGRTVVCCGRKVAGAFGVRAGFLSETEKDGAAFVVLPHPSGVNRWWNSRSNRRRARRLLRRLIASSRARSGGSTPP